MTNADCIRRMNDEQLYDFLSEWECGDIDYSITFCDLCKQGGNDLNLDCDGCRKHWLQRDAVDYGGLMYWKRNTVFEMADSKTDNSETPNNCEHITEDGVTCAKYPACDDCFDNPLNKVKGSKRLLKGKTEPTISKMEQVDKDINVRSKTEPQIDWNETLPCHKCESALSSECTACDGQKYFRTEEGSTDCGWR